ncbi:hypothetical protein MKK75_10555 [Methylobacterium sp. J-030]|uniref:hypothetical protein n=1 Tax=Methylobacterium sp. J-030 TaxID=2836627 RepID=UPI001FBA951E|nr:hypothetical protein [Methylobacterium sp. J-030]MCJ2069239.1 hypothetical protein [Methylobacterium sp. J-030]
MAKKHSCQLLGDIAFQAIRYYSQMAGQLTAIEGFIRDFSAQSYHRATSDRVSVELPIRTFLYQWHVDRNALAGLGNFRIDMAAFTDALRETTIDLDLLVEYKLWTDRFKVASDVSRIKQIIGAVKSLAGHQDLDIGGYVVVCPQYYQGLSAVDGAMSDFSNRFPLCYQRTESLLARNGVTYGVGVAVIDVHQCQPGNFG